MSLYGGIECDMECQNETAWEMLQRLYLEEKEPYDLVDKIHKKCFPDMIPDSHLIVASFVENYTEQEAIKIMQEIERELNGL